MNNVQSILDLGIAGESSLLETLASIFPCSVSSTDENEHITQAISTAEVSNRERDIRKLFTAASKIAQEKELDGFSKIGNLATAVISDNVFTVAKTSYLLANGKISADKVAEIVADKAAVACDCIASFITPEVVNLGLNRLIDVISTVTLHPEIQILKVYTDALACWIAPAAQKNITEGKLILRTTIHVGIAKAGNWLKSNARKIASIIPLLAK